MNRHFAVILIIFIMGSAAHARLLETALKDGIGIRPLGMGGAYTAISDDSCGIFYNPAGLGPSRFEYIHGYGDLKKTYLNNDEFSMFAARDIGIANWNMEDLALGHVGVTAVSYKRSGGNIDYGITCKNVYGSTTSETIAGYSFDLGLKGMFNEQISWGILAQDFYEVNLNIPASVRAGLGYQMGMTQIVVEGEGRNLRDTPNSKIYPHIGIESVLAQGFTGRIGYDKDRYTAGFSISIPVVDVEYAVAVPNDPDLKDSVQMFGFKFHEKKSQ